MARDYIQDATGKDVKKLNGEEVIELLFGSASERGEFKIVDTNWDPKERWYHRLNRFWAYPLFFILAPFQYIIHGKTGFSDDNRFGHWVLKVTGYR
ncbi:MAG: hypothetical protein ACK5NC_11870 [Vibrio sp.]